MRNWVLLLMVICVFFPALAKPKTLGLFDWQHGPQQVLVSLRRDKSNEAQLKMFHKTGQQYIKARLSAIGTRWDSTVYFDESDRPNQLLLQLDKVSKSDLHRIEHLALEQFGRDYQTKRSESKTRDDHSWTWKRDEFEIKLERATYHSDSSLTVWLVVKPYSVP